MARYPEIQYINAYVSGSMAYQFERESHKKVALPKAKPGKRLVIRLDPVALLGIVLAGVFFVLLISGFMKLQDARQETGALDRYVNTLQQENALLQDTYTSGYDLAQVEQIALALGMVPKEEVTTVVVDAPVVLEESAEPSRWEAFWSFLTGLFA